jgi:DNA-binding transcriptional LysR family regulator
VPSILCDAWFRSGALVRIFSVELETNDTYFLVSRPKDAEKPAVKAITQWARGQFRNHPHN